jgi:hypothetical protein
MWLAYESRDRAPTYKRACAAFTSATGKIDDNCFVLGTEHDNVLCTSASEEFDEQKLRMHRRQMVSVSGNTPVTPHTLLKDIRRDRLKSSLPTIPEADVLHALDSKRNINTLFDKVRMQKDRFGDNVRDERLIRCNVKHARYSHVDYQALRANRTQRTYGFSEKKVVGKFAYQPLPSCKLRADLSITSPLLCSQSRSNANVCSSASQPGFVRVVGFDLPSAS